MTIDRKELLSLAKDIDHLTRVLHVSTRPMAKIVDHPRIGPFGAMILFTIRDHEPLPVLALARHLGRDNAQMTRAVQMLERNGLVERNQNPEDGRVSLVKLSQKGRDLADGFQGILADVLAELFIGIDDKKRYEFASTLKKILRSGTGDMGQE